MKLLPSLALGLVPALLAPPAPAQGTLPGSLLVFPQYDNRPGNLTLLTITNTNDAVPQGLIDFHIVYFEEETCLETNRVERLTPNDTITLLTSVHNPGMSRGYAYGYARRVSTGQAVDFDYLIGSSFHADGAEADGYTIEPLVYRGLVTPGASTDVNSNGQRDLDGVEYELASNELYMPRFFGQQDPLLNRRNYWSSDLIVFSPLGPRNGTTTTALLIYNDNEQVFSSQFVFDCWTRVPLLQVSGVFRNSFLVTTSDDAGEVQGWNGPETGWFEMRGQITVTNFDSIPNPPIAAVLVDKDPYTVAVMPFTREE